MALWVVVLVVLHRNSTFVAPRRIFSVSGFGGKMLAEVVEELLARVNLSTCPFAPPLTLVPYL